MEQTPSRLKFYVQADCPDCGHRIFIKQLVTQPEVEDVLSGVQVEKNKEAIKKSLIEKNIIEDKEQLAESLKQIDDPNVVYDDKDTQLALETIQAELLKKKYEQKESTPTEVDKDQELSQS